MKYFLHTLPPSPAAYRNELSPFPCPISKIKSNVNDSIWLKSRKTVQGRSERNFAYRIYFRNRTNENSRSYYKLRNKAKFIINNENCKYGAHLFTNSDNTGMSQNIRKLGCIESEIPKI